MAKAYQPLPERVLHKHREEILDLHKRCIKNYLIQRDLKYIYRKKFFRLYDYYISEKNILEYFNIPINLFVQALIKDTLDIFFRYTNPNLYVRKNRKKSVHRKE